MHLGSGSSKLMVGAIIPSRSAIRQAMIAYVIAGPDGKVIAAGRASPVPIRA